MEITGKLRIKSHVDLAAASVTFDITWQGGRLARMSKDLLKPMTHGATDRALALIRLPEYTMANRTGRSTVLLLQTRLRVVAEREHYLVVAREGWYARIAQAYQTTIDFLVRTHPAMFGWLRSQLV